jgi:hypothetical protein
MSTLSRNDFPNRIAAWPLSLALCVALGQPARALGPSQAIEPGQDETSEPLDEIGAWSELELPSGFRLELATGVVSSRPGGTEILQLVDGVLVSDVPLRVLEGDTWSRERPRILAGTGDAVDELPVELGVEAVFEFGQNTSPRWSRARVRACGTRSDRARADAARALGPVAWRRSRADLARR